MGPVGGSQRWAPAKGPEGLGEVLQGQLLPPPVGVSKIARFNAVGSAVDRQTLRGARFDDI